MFKIDNKKVYHLSDCSSLLLDGSLPILINGKEATNDEDFLKQIYSKLCFPDPQYMNWNAYIDWMRDLSWISEHSICIIVSDWELFLGSSAKRTDFESEFNDDILHFWTNEQKEYGEDDPHVRKLIVIATEQDYESIAKNKALINECAAVYYAKGFMRSFFNADVIAGLETDMHWIFTGGDKSSDTYGNPRVQISKENGELKILNVGMRELFALAKNGKPMQLAGG